jgi:hypothetical protein
VRRDALDRKRPCYSNLSVILVGFVVEVFVLRLGGDGGVDLLLAGDALLPPSSMQLSRLGRPLVLGVAWDLPVLPRLAERLVELCAQRLERLLELLPDDVDLGVVGNRI